MELYKKDREVVATYNYFVYDMEIYEYGSRFCTLKDYKRFKQEKPLIRTKSDKDYIRNPKTNVSRIRTFTLKYAPENYLIENNYEKISPNERYLYLQGF